MTKLWGSRFDGQSDNLADKFSFSISYDYRLAKYDCLGGIAHAKMLGDQKIIPAKDSKAIISGLNKILDQINRGTYKFDVKAEDIHTDIQQSLKKLIGTAADKLHTARSRNDLVVLDMKMYCIEELEQVAGLISNVQRALVKLAEKNIDVIIPAYTHLQSAQVVLFAHHMLAYVEMLNRDFERVLDNIVRINETMPLGSCALSGSGLPTDRQAVAKDLGFEGASHNSMDSVSDRDFIIETLSNLAILGMHISRICEDLIIWSTTEFNYVSIDWSLCTGSSIMPHKKNPDMCELMRGESSKLISNLTEVLILCKGLSLTYNRDLQLDKPPLFESVEKSKDMLGLLEKTFQTLNVNKEKLKSAVEHEPFFSVDIMDYLIKKGVSYREAHDTVGKMIKNCTDKGKNIADLTKAELKKFSPKLEEGVKKILNASTSVKNKQSYGSTNPSQVKKQIQRWKKVLG